MERILIQVRLNMESQQDSIGEKLVLSYYMERVHARKREMYVDVWVCATRENETL